MAGAIIQWAEQLQDASKAATQRWANNKAETIAAKYAGEIAGWILALEVDEFDIAGWAKDGFIVERLNDMSPTGRRVVVNLETGTN